MADDFEAVLERCRERLSEISLDLPDLERGAPPRPRYELEPPSPARPAPRPEPADPPAHADSPAAPEAPEEPEVFPPAPPPRPRVLTPVPAPPPAPTPAPPSAEGPAARPSRRSWAWGTAAAAAVALGAVLWARRPPAAIQMTLPGAETFTRRTDGGGPVVLRAGELVQLAPDGSVVSATPLDAPIDSLSWDHGSLWSANARTPEIEERAGAGRPTVFRLNHVPEDIYVGGGELWTIEKGERQIHQYLISRSILGAMLQPLDIFELPGLSPSDLAVDDSGILWVLDEPTRRLCRLRAKDGSYQLIDAASLSPIVGASASVIEFELDGPSLWVLSRDGSSAPPILRRVPVSRLTFTPG